MENSAQSAVGSITRHTPSQTEKCGRGGGGGVEMGGGRGYSATRECDVWYCVLLGWRASLLQRECEAFFSLFFSFFFGGGGVILDAVTAWQDIDLARGIFYLGTCFYIHQIS